MIHWTYDPARGENVPRCACGEFPTMLFHGVCPAGLICDVCDSKEQMTPRRYDTLRFAGTQAEKAMEVL